MALIFEILIFMGGLDKELVNMEGIKGSGKVSTKNLKNPIWNTLEVFELVV